jgi:hypothetical protein
MTGQPVGFVPEEVEELLLMVVKDVELVIEVVL